MLMDFGLSHDVASAQAFGGIPFYMGPELISGSPATPKTDIYALFCITR